jgi:hypothetical protein
MDTKTSFVEKTSSFISRQGIVKNSFNLSYNLQKVSEHEPLKRTRVECSFIRS